MVLGLFVCGFAFSFFSMSNQNLRVYCLNLGVIAKQIDFLVYFICMLLLCWEALFLCVFTMSLEQLLSLNILSGNCLFNVGWKLITLIYENFVKRPPETFYTHVS